MSNQNQYLELSVKYLLDSKQIERLETIRKKLEKHPKGRNTYTLEDAFNFVMMPGAKHMIDDNLQYYESYLSNLLEDNEEIEM